MKKFLPLIALMICTIGAYAQVTTVTLTGGIGGKDALIGHDPNANLSGTPDLACNTWTCGGNLCLYRGLIRFDLSAVQPGDSLVSASLSLHANLNSGTGYNGQPTYGTNNAGWLKRITSSWNVDSVTWNNQPGTTDANEVVLAQSDSADESYLNMDVTGMVSNMFAIGNYGFMLMEQNETTPYNSLIFGSSANADSTIRPVLVLKYVPRSTQNCLTLVGGIGGKDALIGHDPNTNDNGTPDLACNTWTCGGNVCLFRGLIQFDLSAIQPGDTIESARLSLYANLNSGQGYNGQPTYGTNNAGWLKRITSAWQVDSVTWNNQPTTSDLNEVVLAQSDSADESYLNLDVTGMVSDMLANGNHGFMLMEQNETTPYNSLIFGSSANSDPNIRPVLQVCYSSVATGIQAFTSPQPVIKVYPNPATNEITIRVNRELQTSAYYLIDLTGRVLLNGKLANETTTVDIQSLDAGIYFIRINEQGGQTFKIVKQ